MRKHDQRRRVAVLTLLGVLLASVVSFMAPAQAANTWMTKLTSYEGATTERFSNLSPIGDNFSSAAVLDADKDGVTDVIAGFPDGVIRYWSVANPAQPALKRSYKVMEGAVQASPLVADVNNDGRNEIVYATVSKGSLGWVGVLDLEGNWLLRKAYGFGGVIGTPALGDFNSDGYPDIVFGGYDQHLHVLDLRTGGNELPGFPIRLHDTIWSSPAVGDIDGDKQPEIVMGFDCDGAPGQWCYPSYGGYLGAWNGDGSQVWAPRFVEHQVVWSSPALADMNNDGADDIIVGTGNMPSQMIPPYGAMRGKYVYGYNGRTGAYLPGWPVAVEADVTSSPAIGDVTGDGRLDVAIVAGNGLLHLIDNNGTKLWWVCAGNEVTAMPGSGCPRLAASASIADIDNDGRQEVIVGGEQNLHAFEPNGALEWSAETAQYNAPVSAVPTIASINGKAVVITATVKVRQISTDQWDTDYGRLFIWTTGAPLGRADWPTFKHDPARSGNFKGSMVRQMCNTAPVAAFTGSTAVPDRMGMVPIEPARLLDTRDKGPDGGPGCFVAPGRDISLKVTGVGGVPSSGVSAVAINLTGTRVSRGTYLAAYPAGTAWAGTSSVNLKAGQDVAALVIVPVGTDGRIALSTGVASGDLIVDVLGYFAAGGSRYNPLPSSQRVLNDVYLKPGWTGFSPQVPATATAVMGNVTSNVPAGGGYMSLRPAVGTAPAATSTVNYKPRAMAANRAISKLGADRNLGLFNFAQQHGIVDINGYFAATGAGYQPLVPARLIDTSADTSRHLGPLSTFKGGVPAQLPVAGVPLGSSGARVPVGAKAAVVTLTGTNVARNTHVTVWASGPIPATSDLNLNAGEDVANLVVVPLDAQGKAMIQLNAGSADLIVDVLGYFA